MKEEAGLRQGSRAGLRQPWLGALVSLPGWDECTHLVDLVGSAARGQACSQAAELGLREGRAAQLRACIEWGHLHHAQSGLQRDSLLGKLFQRWDGCAANVNVLKQQAVLHAVASPLPGQYTCSGCTRRPSADLVPLIHAGLQWGDWPLQHVSPQV